MNELALIWVALIAFCIIMYVILDGFTLGTGMLMAFLNADERNLAMSVILPTWDGNQTWLVLGTASLYGAFPLAFSILLPILYLPIFLMLIALLFRGVAFEFRLKSEQGRAFWDHCFIISSLLAAFIQGMVLGTFIQGLEISFDATEVINHYQWLSPFTLFTGLAVVYGYALLGSTRLILKTKHRIQHKMYRIANVSTVLVALCLAITSFWTPLIHPAIAIRWFYDSNLRALLILPICAGLAILGLLFALRRRYENLPYWLSVIIFLCSYFGVAMSEWPYIVPYSITIWQAASPASSLKFMLFGAAIMLPLLLFYTGYAYHIFRGKVTQVIGYE